MLSEENLARVRALDEIARRRGQSLAQMAYAWVLRDPRVTTTLIGASSPEQVRENVGRARRTSRSPPTSSPRSTVTRSRAASTCGRSRAPTSGRSRRATREPARGHEPGRPVEPVDVADDRGDPRSADPAGIASPDRGQRTTQMGARRHASSRHAAVPAPEGPQAADRRRLLRDVRAAGPHAHLDRAEPGCPAGAERQHDRGDRPPVHGELAGLHRGLAAGRAPVRADPGQPGPARRAAGPGAADAQRAVAGIPGAAAGGVRAHRGPPGGDGRRGQHPHRVAVPGGRSPLHERPAPVLRGGRLRRPPGLRPLRRRHRERRDHLLAVRRAHAPGRPLAGPAAQPGQPGRRPGHRRRTGRPPPPRLARSG